jgi:hypothetical protein
MVMSLFLLKLFLIKGYMMSVELLKALEAKSDRLNADDLMSGPRIIKITDVRVTMAKDGNITVKYEGCGEKPWKPSKGMGRSMALMWGDDETKWAGKRVELFRNPDVEYGSMAIGGIQICGASHIECDLILQITVKRGKKQRLPVRKLHEETVETTIDTTAMLTSLRNVAADGMDALKEAWGSLPANVRKSISPSGCPDELKKIATDADAEKKEN